MNANELLEAIYSESAKGTFPKPKTLTHFVGGNTGSSLAEVEAVRSGGLQVRQGWTSINEMLPNRPLGVFFWGEEMAEHGHLDSRIQVSVTDLDTDKLFAFPSELAQAADAKCCGRELIAEAIEVMALAQPVPYSEYLGTFAAEWIYTEEVPSTIIK
ncbi:MAG: hypothetical protein WAU00_08085 [Caldilinea sp.]|jgi:hypothetical protein